MGAGVAAMDSALSHVAWETSLVEPGHDPAMEAYARRRIGMPHITVRYFLAAPWVARTVVDLHVEFGLLLKLDQRTADLIGLVVSQENSCRFCYAIVRSTLWLQGMDAQRIQRVEQDFSRADLAPRTQAAIAYARAQSRSGRQARCRRGRPCAAPASTRWRRRRSPSPSPSPTSATARTRWWRCRTCQPSACPSMC